MAEQYAEIWDIWYPKAGATGMSFARGRIGEQAEVMLVHAAPQILTVALSNLEGATRAKGTDLPSTDDTPITRLTVRGNKIEREDIWPTEADVGCLVLLPGGEVGRLLQWWHADDHSEWRWQIEFYNHR